MSRSSHCSGLGACHGFLYAHTPAFICPGLNILFASISAKGKIHLFPWLPFYVIHPYQLQLCCFFFKLNSPILYIICSSHNFGIYTCVRYKWLFKWDFIVHAHFVIGTVCIFCQLLCCQSQDKGRLNSAAGWNNAGTMATLPPSKCCFKKKVPFK